MPVNPGAALSDPQVRHLLRRTGLGVLPKEFARLQGRSRGEAADILLAFKGKGFKPGGKFYDQMHDKWVKYILKTKFALHEKLVFFWHDHFATGFTKVQDTKLMGAHIQLIHLFARGNLRDFVKAMGRNAAMMEWLDTVRNRKNVPNENYGRELCELFTLGVHDLTATPQPNYDQEDVVSIARAFTGWRYDDHNGQAFLDEDQHDFKEDFPSRGPKVIFKTHGGFGPGGRAYDDQGEGEPEIDRVIDIIFEHRDADGKNTVARRTAYRLCEYFAHGNPSMTFVDEVVADSGFDGSFEIGDLLRSILIHDDFYLTAAGGPYTAGVKKSVKWPIDFVAGTLRMLNMKPKGKTLTIRGGSYNRILDHLDNMGQLLADPPSVFGWNWETAWLSSSTLLARYNFARDVTSAREGGTGFRPDRVMDLSLTAPGAIVDAVTTALGVQDHIQASERTIFINYLTDNGAHPTLDLSDFDVRNEKLHGLFALVMQSPAYQLH